MLSAGAGALAEGSYYLSSGHGPAGAGVLAVLYYTGLVNWPLQAACWCCRRARERWRRACRCW